ncbi:MAG: cysteine hydrolase [Proteobacteria bacterium]|nr:cysteine hydrolase [Pseudomonadota bacterium]MDA1057924.1 cysteine hydrolase [Pseudomonadota bacterium]
MTIKLGKENCALIVVDMQNGFLDGKGSMAQLGFAWEKLAAASPGVQRLVAGARKAKVPIFWTRYVYEPDFRDGGVQIEEIMPMMKDVKLCVAGTWDAEIHPDMKTEDGDTIIDKNRPSSFYATRLESYLRAQGIENVVVCGVTTNICVETTVRDASQRDFRTFVVRDAVGEVDDFRGQTALKAMEYLFARVLNVNEVLDEWGVELSNAA